MIDKHSPFDVIRREKGAEILALLRKGARCITEIQETIGGSNTTIARRIQELKQANILEEEFLTGTEYGYIPRNKTLLRLTEDGRKWTDVLERSGLLSMPLLPKDRERWILLNLFAHGQVRGKTRLMKLLFLQKHELHFIKGNFYSFVPWLYGPYSEEVSEDLDELRIEDIINVKIEKHHYDHDGGELILSVYTLTSKGQSLVPKLLEKLPDNTIEKLGLLTLFNRMPLKELLRYIYEKYSRFTTKSM